MAEDCIMVDVPLMADDSMSSGLSDVPSDFEGKTDDGWGDDDFDAIVRPTITEATLLVHPLEDLDMIKVDNTHIIHRSIDLQPTILPPAPAPKEVKAVKTEVILEIPAEMVSTPPSPPVVPSEQEEDNTNVTRSSRRKRAAPVRLEEEIHEATKKSPAATRKRGPVRGTFTPDFLLQNPKSKLTTIDLAVSLTQ